MCHKIYMVNSNVKKKLIKGTNCCKVRIKNLNKTE